MVKIKTVCVLNECKCVCVHVSVYLLEKGGERGRQKTGHFTFVSRVNTQAKSYFSANRMGNCDGQKCNFPLEMVRNGNSI